MSHFISKEELRRYFKCMPQTLDPMTRNLEDSAISYKGKINTLPTSKEVMFLGDFNAKVCQNRRAHWPEVVGQYGVGVHNDRGLHLLQFCAIHNLIISNTTLKNKQVRLTPLGFTRQSNQTSNRLHHNRASLAGQHKKQSFFCIHCRGSYES